MLRNFLMVTLGQGRRKFLVCIKEKNLYFCCSLWISLERDLKYNRQVFRAEREME